MIFRDYSACATLFSLTTLLIGCHSDSMNPSAPTSQSAINPGLSHDRISLKATVPELISPADGVILNHSTVVLTASNSTTAHDVPWILPVRFAVYAHSNIGQPVHTDVITQEQRSTTLTVPAGVLQDSTVYVWRVRAESNGAYGPWSVIHGFTTEFASIEPPLPLLPIGGIVTNTLRPPFTLKNGTIVGDPGTVLIEVELSTDSAFTNGVQILRTHTRSRGETNLFLNNDLLPSTKYYWRGRSTNRNLPKTSLLPEDRAITPNGFSTETSTRLTSDWSATVNFRTPAVVTNTNYRNSETSVNPFTQEITWSLVREDPDWRYRTNGQNDNPANIDIVLNAGGTNPIFKWNGHGQVGWISTSTN